MEKALLITEKPSVTKVIKAVYLKHKKDIPYDIEFTSASGHLLALCDPDEYNMAWGSPWKSDVLPMIPETWKKKVINTKYFNEIKKMWNSGNYDVVINAGDAGREGQLIQHFIYEEIGINVPILRFWTDDYTEKTVLKALKSMKSDDEYKGLTDASYLRVYFDWLCGMNFSRAATLALDRMVRIGRVQTATLSMIVSKELAIQNFKSIKYNELEALFKLPSGDVYKGTLINADADDTFPSKYAFFDKNELFAIKNELYNTGMVKSVTEKENVIKAPTLFNLTDLQKECSVKFKMSPSETLNIAQGLYEKNHVSYPRTESKCITTEQAKEIPGLLLKLKQIAELSEFTEKALSDKERLNKTLSSKKYVDNKKVIDHPALIPTEEIPDLSSLGDRERNVYLLIVKRLIAIFFSEMITISIVVITKTDGYPERIFRSAGTVVKQWGWKEVYGKDAEDNHTALPQIYENDPVTATTYEVKDKETSAPKRYTDATILTAMETAGKTIPDKELEQVLMECSGLGTAATRADILKKLIDYRYVYKDKSSLIPTDEGIQLIGALEGHNIISPELTAKWEKKLRDVERKELDFNNFYKFMCIFVETETKDLLNLKKLGRYTKKINVCPICQKDFLDVGNYYCCTGYMEKDGENHLCPLALPKKYGERTLSPSDINDLISGNATKKYRFKWGNGKTSTASLILETDEKGNYTGKLGFAKPASVGKCPLCGGNILKGKGFYCENAAIKDNEGNRKCKFSVYGFIGKTEVTSEQASEVFNNGETEKFIKVTWQSGKKYMGKLILSSYEGGYAFAIKPFEEKTVCDCPYCRNGTIKETQYYYECTETSCDFKTYKSTFSYDITHNDLKMLLGGQILNRKLTFPKQGTRNTKFKLIKEDGKYKTKFVK